MLNHFLKRHNVYESVYIILGLINYILDDGKLSFIDRLVYIFSEYYNRPNTIILFREYVYFMLDQNDRI